MLPLPRRLLFLLLALLLVGSSHLPASDRLVISPVRREAVLENARSYLDGTDPAFTASLQKARNPFIAELAEPAAPPPLAAASADEESSGETAPAGPAVIPDGVILQAIASQIRPRGVLRKGGSQVLILEQGKLEIGSTFTARYSGEQYSVVVQDITSRHFTLRLREAHVTRPHRMESAPRGAFLDEQTAE